MTSQDPLVDIVVLNYNGWRDTVDCLESVLRLLDVRFRVIVCDNASTDDSMARLEQWARGEMTFESSVPPGLRHLVTPATAKPIDHIVLDRIAAEAGRGDPRHRLVLIQTGANLGFAGGNNVGLRYALARNEAAFVLLLNNDTLIEPTAVAKMIAVAERDVRIGVVGATILEYQEPDIVQEAAGGTFGAWHGMVRPNQTGARRGATKADQRLDYVSGGCLFVRVTVLQRVGLLDERFFMYGEDVDFGLRVRRAGFALAYCTDAEIWHRGGGTSGRRSPFSDYHNVRSSLHFVAKHYPYLLPAAAAYSVYRCVLPKVARGQWNRLEATGRGYRDFVKDLTRSSHARHTPSGSGGLEVG